MRSHDGHMMGTCISAVQELLYLAVTSVTITLMAPGRLQTKPVLEPFLERPVHILYSNHYRPVHFNRSYIGFVTSLGPWGGEGGGERDLLPRFPCRS